MKVFSPVFGEIELKEEEENKFLVVTGDVIYADRDGYLPDPQDLKLGGWGEWEEKLVREVSIALEEKGYKVKKTYYDEDWSDKLRDDVYVIEVE